MHQVSSSGGRLTDIRTFFQEKLPNTHIEAAVVVAFFYEHVAPIDERRETINAEVLKRAFIQANWKLPKAIRQVLPDTKLAGYVDKTSQSGEFKLNAVGYNLVAHTLGTGSSKQRPQDRKSPKRKK